MRTSLIVAIAAGAVAAVVLATVAGVALMGSDTGNGLPLTADEAPDTSDAARPVEDAGDVRRGGDPDDGAGEHDGTAVARPDSEPAADTEDADPADADEPSADHDADDGGAGAVRAARERWAAELKELREAAREVHDMAQALQQRWVSPPEAAQVGGAWHLLVELSGMARGVFFDRRAEALRAAMSDNGDGEAAERFLTAFEAAGADGHGLWRDCEALAAALLRVPVDAPISVPLKDDRGADSFPSEVMVGLALLAIMLQDLWLMRESMPDATDSSLAEYEHLLRLVMTLRTHGDVQFTASIANVVRLAARSACQAHRQGSPWAALAVTMEEETRTWLRRQGILHATSIARHASDHAAYYMDLADGTEQRQADMAGNDHDEDELDSLNMLIESVAEYLTPTMRAEALFLRAVHDAGRAEWDVFDREHHEMLRAAARRAEEQTGEMPPTAHDALEAPLSLLEAALAQAVAVRHFRGERLVPLTVTLGPDASVSLSQPDDGEHAGRTADVRYADYLYWEPDGGAHRMPAELRLDVRRSE